MGVPHGALDELTERRRAETLRTHKTPCTLRIWQAISKTPTMQSASAGLSIEDVRMKANPAGRPCLPRQIAAELREMVRAWPFKLSPVQVAEKSRLLEWCQEEFEAAGELILQHSSISKAAKINLNRRPPKSPKKFCASSANWMPPRRRGRSPRRAFPHPDLPTWLAPPFDEELPRSAKPPSAAVDFKRFSKRTPSAC